jgi:hypothetical protein
MYLLYIRIQSILPSKHSSPRLYKTNLLIFYKAKVAVWSEIHTHHINTKQAPRRIFQMSNLVVYKVIARLLKVKNGFKQTRMTMRGFDTQVVYFLVI